MRLLPTTLLAKVMANVVLMDGGNTSAALHNTKDIQNMDVARGNKQKHKTEYDVEQKKGQAVRRRRQRSAWGTHEQNESGARKKKRGKSKSPKKKNEQADRRQSYMKVCAKHEHETLVRKHRAQ
jgi:hypothetical protein